MGATLGGLDLRQDFPTAATHHLFGKVIARMQARGTASFQDYARTR
jgi:hypothetical protein